MCSRMHTTTTQNTATPIPSGAQSTTPNGVVYAGSQDHNVYALDATTGTKVWNYKTRGIVSSSPTVAMGSDKKTNING